MTQTFISGCELRMLEILLKIEILSSKKQKEAAWPPGTSHLTRNEIVTHILYIAFGCWLAR